MKSDNRLENCTLGDFRTVMAQLARPEIIERMMSTLKVNGVLREELCLFDAKEMRTGMGVIDAMTAEERRDHKLINLSRTRRIAAGSGVDLQRVTDLLKQYEMLIRMIQPR